MFSEKNPTITDLMRRLTGKERTIGECVTCEAPNLKFKDELSAKEYAISGMCQNCQDKIDEMDDC